MLSFRKRLALVHFVAIVGVLAVAAAAAFWFLSRAVHGQLDAALLALAEQEQAMLSERGDQPVRIHEAKAGPLPPSFVRLDRLVQIIDADGHVLARSANLGESQLPAPQALLARLAAGETVVETLLGYGEEPTRMVSLPMPGQGRAFAIQVAGSLDDVNHVVQSAGELFIVMGIVLIGVVGVAGSLLTRRVFLAIDGVVLQARRIGEGSLGERLPHPGTRDEIGRLVDTLNEMLGRIERGFEAQRRFTADASHELRSPLSRLRTELEVTLRRPREAAEYVTALRSCVEEVERLTLLVEELLTLARLDAGQERAAIEGVSLNAVVEDAIRRHEGTAREGGIGLRFEAGADVVAPMARGPAGLVLANLLDNAIKFSPPGGEVTVRLTSNDEEARIDVADAGPGIGADELPHVFERFYRGPTARAAETQGLGLGLALSQAIAHAHGARIEATNRPEGGALFSMRIRLRQTVATAR
jgi:two-component system OmpR family sensor kinase